ncbi:MAG: hypothetical protein WC325_03220 [Candidatus Bathyarchaeia archaeon]|jgi:hypothetical protein
MRTKVLFTVFVVAVLCSATTVVTLVVANPVPVYSLAMPEEYIDYTVVDVNGTLWAKIDGTYPLTKYEVDCQNQTSSTSTVFEGENLQLVYPTPPNTTNIMITFDGVEQHWSNYTETFPEATHYTAIGNWPMIACTLEPVLGNFNLTIHYEHPIQQINGSYAFLYDLNITPYISEQTNRSTAYFTIKFETEPSNLAMNRVTEQGKLTPATFVTSTADDQTQTETLQIVSDYSKPLLGDLLVTFNQNQETDDAPQVSTGELVLIIVILVASVAASIYMILRRRRQPKTRNNKK